MDLSWLASKFYPRGMYVLQKVGCRSFAGIQWLKILFFAAYRCFVVWTSVDRDEKSPSMQSRWLIYKADIFAARSERLPLAHD